jgi:hypothetical protein
MSITASNPNPPSRRFVNRHGSDTWSLFAILGCLAVRIVALACGY